MRGLIPLIYLPFKCETFVMLKITVAFTVDYEDFIITLIGLAPLQGQNAQVSMDNSTLCFTSTLPPTTLVELICNPWCFHNTSILGCAWWKWFSVSRVFCLLRSRLKYLKSYHQFAWQYVKIIRWIPECQEVNIPVALYLWYTWSMTIPQN